MKKTLFIFLVATILMSCSGGNSDDNTTNFYIKFKINGIQKEYRNGSLATNYKYVKSENKHVNLSVGGANIQSIDAPEKISMNLYSYENSTVDLVAGTYNTNTKGYYLDAFYFENNAHNYDEDFTITITHIDKQTAKGTFSGTTESGHIITEGEFFTKVFYNEVEN